jgi:uncharacterized protein YdeI (YjbR/CyaY-like superfamily)
MIDTNQFDKVEVTSARQLRDWLKPNHTRIESVWLVTFKKHVEGKYVSVDEVFDELLCFGWIDGASRRSA